MENSVFQKKIKKKVVVFCLLTCEREISVSCELKEKKATCYEPSHFY